MYYLCGPQTFFSLFDPRTRKVAHHCSGWKLNGSFTPPQLYALWKEKPRDPMGWKQRGPHNWFGCSRKQIPAPVEDQTQIPLLSND
jgi:hypothetical protein